MNYDALRTHHTLIPEQSVAFGRKKKGAYNILKRTLSEIYFIRLPISKNSTFLKHIQTVF